MNESFLKALRIVNTVSDAIPTGAELFGSFYYSVTGIGKYFAGVIVGVFGGVGQGISTHFLEGEAIVEEPEHFFKEGGTVNATEQTRLIVRNDNPSATSGCCTTEEVKRYCTQSLYLASDTLSEGANRYFLLTVFNRDILKSTLPIPLFWSIFGVSIVFSTFFRASNATYYGTEAIAKYHNKNHSYLVPLLKWFCEKHPNFVKFVCVFGSAEHTLSHMLAVFLAIPTTSFLTLEQEFLVLYYIVLGTGGVLGLALLALTFAQTWLFDAMASYDVMQVVNPGTDQFNRLSYPRWLASLLFHTMPIMAVVIGLEKGIAINQLGKELIPPSIIQKIIPPVSAAVVGLARGLGTFFSEVREAMSELKEAVFNVPEAETAPVPNV